MADLIEAMEAALASFSAGAVKQPVRTVIEAPGGFFGTMPAYLGSTPAMGAKLVTVFHDNPRHGLPTHLATILLLDPATGNLLAILDGRFITEARTAAVSAVATRYLAREDAAVLAIIGSGVQARSHLEALSLVRKFIGCPLLEPVGRARGRLRGGVEELSGARRGERGDGHARRGCDRAGHRLANAGD